MGGSAGGAGTTGTAGAGGTAATAYIVGDIDGVTARGDGAVAYRLLSLGAANIRIEVGTPEWIWQLVFTNAVGTPTTCGIQVASRTPGPFVLYSSSATGGSCTANITRAAPNVGDEIEGTFSGVVNAFLGGTSATPPLTITNGRLRAVRSEDWSGNPGG